jgi:hypothetical protein
MHHRSLTRHERKGDFHPIVHGRGWKGLWQGGAQMNLTWVAPGHGQHLPRRRATGSPKGALVEPSLVKGHSPRCQATTGYRWKDRKAAGLARDGIQGSRSEAGGMVMGVARGARQELLGIMQGQRRALRQRKAQSRDELIQLGDGDPGWDIRHGTLHGRAGELPLWFRRPGWQATKKMMNAKALVLFAHEGRQAPRCARAIVGQGGKWRQANSQLEAGGTSV